MSIDSDNIGIVVVGLVILWVVWRARRRARSPEAQQAAAEREAARAEATAGLPDGWSVSRPDRERYGAGRDGIDAYAVVAEAAGGERLVGVALTEAGAYRTAVAAVRGEIEETDAWSPPVSDLATATVNATADADITLPLGWTLVGVDYESYLSGGHSIPTYGALAIGPGGQRALAVTRDKSTAPHRLIDRIEGRLQVSDGWAFRLATSESGSGGEHRPAS